MSDLPLTGASMAAQRLKKKKKKKTPINAGDVGLITGSEMSPEKGNGNSLQCSCLGNPMDRGAWWATVLGVTESLT